MTCTNLSARENFKDKLVEKLVGFNVGDQLDFLRRYGMRLENFYCEYLCNYACKTTGGERKWIGQ